MMNVVKLEAGLPGEFLERLTGEAPGMYIVQPDETAIKSMERMLRFHMNPQPIIDYSRLSSLHPDAQPTVPVDMPDFQAPIHAEAANILDWQLEHAREHVVLDTAGVQVEFIQAA